MQVHTLIYTYAFSIVVERSGNRMGQEANCAGAYRRRRDKSTSSTSFPPRTLHLRLFWMP